jgi:hypothetical protein
MADPQRITDDELEGALRDLAPRYPYPPTPNLANRVRLRISAKPIAPRRLELWRDPRRLALVAAVLLVLLGAAALANPASRDAIAHFFHVRGVIVNREPSPLPSFSPVTPLDLGRRTTMADAQSKVSFPIAVPPALGEPDAVYVVNDIPGGEVSLAYTPRPGIPLVKQTGLGILVTEFRGDLNPGFLMKGLGQGTTAEEVSVHGDQGWWIAGEPHMIYVEIRGNGQQVSLRMAANTLIWEHDGVTYRIESGLSKADAFRLATGLP